MKKLISKCVIGLAALTIAVMCPAEKAKAGNVVEFTKNLSLNKTFNDTLSEGDGKYKFTINRSGTLTVQIGFYEGSGYSWGYHGGVTLYDRDGEAIANAGVNDSTKGTDSNVFTVDILAGEYYLYVDRAHGTVDYYLSTSFVDSKETVADTLTNTHNSQANPIKLSLGKTYTGHLAENSVGDVYKLSLKKSQVVTIKNTNRTNGVMIGIINSNNTVNNYYKIYGNAESLKMFCPKGTYYITVSKYDKTGTYTISAKSTDIPTTKIKKVYNKRGQIMAVKFSLKSNDVVKGYQIQYATDKKFKKGRRSVYVTNSEYLQSTYSLNMPKKKTYYVRMRTYAEDNRGNKYYSKWSSVKKVAIKK